MSGRRVARRRRPFLVALVAALGGLVGLAGVLAIVAAAFVGSVASSYDDNRTTIATPFPQDDDRPAASGGAVNVLLLGSDSRDGYDPNEEHTSGQRSDAVMLVHVPADRSAVYLMSIMRDSWVDIPGHGTAKLNAAFSLGGVPLAVQTVESLLDVRIDHVAEIDFVGFRGMTEALGGVDVVSTEAFRSDHHEFVQGVNHLDADEALEFVRTRYAFADADFTRVRNQQAFMRGLLDKTLSRGTLTSPTTVRDFVTATSRYLSVDAGFDFQTVAGLAWSLRDLRADDLATFTMPTAGTATSADGQSYVAVNEVALPGLRSALRSDDLGTWLAAQPG